MVRMMIGLLAIGLGTRGTLVDWNHLLYSSNGRSSVSLLMAGFVLVGTSLAAERYRFEEFFLKELTRHAMDMKDDK
jgi:hypothetical protein